MDDHKDIKNYDVESSDEVENEPPEEVHFFCKLTFGQFFTMMVLEVITLCFVFYLGARYGNEYLKLGTVADQMKEPAVVIKSGLPSDAETADLKEMAQRTLESGNVDLKGRVNEILAREQGAANNAPTPQAVSLEPATAAAQVPQTTPIAEALPQQAPNVPANVQLPPGAEKLSPETLKELFGDAAVQAKTAPVPTPEAAPGSVRPGEEQPAEVVRVKSGDSKFSVQVGSYPDVKEANYRVEEWKSRGYSAFMVIANLGEKGQWYRVRVGAFGTKDEADRYLTDLSSREGITDAFVVQNEQ